MKKLTSSTEWKAARDLVTSQRMLGCLLCLLCLPSVLAAQTYLGVVDDSRGFLDRSFLLLKRDTNKQFSISDSTAIFPNFINLKYHVDNDAVYWLFDQPGPPPRDTTVGLVRFKIKDGHMEEGEWLKIPVSECGRTGDYEFIVNRAGQYVLSGAALGVAVDLHELKVVRLD